MSDEAPKFAVVPFTPRGPEPRGEPDPRDQIITNMHKLALLADKQLEHYELWSQHMANMLALALQLADAERWAELHDFLKTAAAHAERAATGKTRIASDLPAGAR